MRLWSDGDDEEEGSESQSNLAASWVVHPGELAHSPWHQFPPVPHYEQGKEFRWTDWQWKDE